MTQKQQYIKAKYCGCEFVIKVVQPAETNRKNWDELSYIIDIQHFPISFIISNTEHDNIMTFFIR